MVCVTVYQILKQCEKGENYSGWARVHSGCCVFLFYSTQMQVGYLEITYFKVGKY